MNNHLQTSLAFAIDQSVSRQPVSPPSFIRASARQTDVGIPQTYLGGNLPIGSRVPRVEQDGGVVLQGADDAALGAAVAAVADAAGARRAVVGVDVVVRRRELARRRVAVAVGPRGHGREVVGRGVAQQALEVRPRRRRYEVARDVRHRLVAHGAPGQGARERRGREEREGR